MQKIVLVHGRYFNSWEALGLGYIGAFIKKNAPGVQLEYFQGCFDDDAEIIASCKDADIVAFSCTSPTYPHTINLARAIKAINPQVRTVVGGYHPSAGPGECLVPGIDQVVVGEGESAMMAIINGDRSPVVNGPIMEFNDLPFPDRELIRNERNIGVAYADTGQRITSFQSHRACPFQCVFCADGFNKVLYGGNIGKAPVRYRDVGNLLDEIEQVVDTYQLDLIKFSDPTWNTSMEWVASFCKAKTERGITVPFYPNIHATIMSPETAQLMASAGCHEVAIGIESGSPKILKQIGKGTTVQTIKNCVGWFKDAGILARGYFLLGMPDETESDLELTESLAEELDLDEYGFTILCPYPGTKMYDPVRFSEVDWEQTDEYSNDFWNGDHLTNQQLKQWQERLTSKFKDKLTWHNRVLVEANKDDSTG
jgi:anaerobic magnesium-protoporphyrin IX monomethyl ester cyclase